jgi:hypothetical protein
MAMRWYDWFLFALGASVLTAALSLSTLGS